MTEDDLEQIDSRNGAPLLECLVIGLVLLEFVVAILVSIWLWEL